jgi:hypothetical protein
MMYFAAAVSFLATPTPLNSAIPYSTSASTLSASAAAPSRRVASRSFFGSPLPSF